MSLQVFTGWALLLIALAGCHAVQNRTTSLSSRTPRERTNFNQGWRFAQGDPADLNGQISYETTKAFLLSSSNAFTRNAAATRPADAPEINATCTQPGFDDSSWRQLDLPHDWAVESAFQQNLSGETGKLPYPGVGWYRKKFTIAAADIDRRIGLEIDGAMSYSTVWVNGHLAGGWPYGYATYQVDLTPYVVPGQNIVAIRLDNPDGSSRWYPGGGIYRNIWLTKTSRVHVASSGTYVTTPTVAPEKAAVAVVTRIQNDSSTTAAIDVTQRIYEANREGQCVGPPLADSGSVSLSVSANNSVEATHELSLTHPKLWQLHAPARYVLVTSVQSKKQLLDEYQTVFGVRTIAFDKENGFLLNGQRVPLNGVCNHHDLGPLGSAFNTRALERQIELLQEMGCNAIRTSHNPPAPELLDLCDRMGMLVMDEAFDCWESGKRRNDYHLLFADWHERDLRAFLRRDRNHPCVILWSIGNELKEFLPRVSGGLPIAAELARIVHEEDSTRLTTFACNIREAFYSGFQKTIGVFGINYNTDTYEKFRSTFPDTLVIGSETSSCISSRGEYFFPISDDQSKGAADNQVSSYDMTAPGWAATPDAQFAALDRSKFVAGEFVWTGFDYIGEPTPYNLDAPMARNMIDHDDQVHTVADVVALGTLQYPSRSSYFGILDLCGFKKDRFYMYQARWRPDLPMAHILPHWNWPERVGQITPVHVYTSGDEAELFLNGRSLGRKTKAPFTYRLRWDDVVYQPGELKVVAYLHGRQWAEEVVKTTGSASQIKLSPDRKQIAADGKDLSFVTVSLTDTAGMTVPRSKNKLHFEIDGPGEIVAIDNGDPTSHLPFHSHDYSVFNGLCLVIVRAAPGQGGAITLKAIGENLPAASVNIDAKK